MLEVPASTRGAFFLDERRRGIKIAKCNLIKLFPAYLDCGIQYINKESRGRSLSGINFTVKECENWFIQLGRTRTV